MPIETNKNNERFSQSLEIKDKESLIAALKAAQVDVSLWGKGEAKTVEHLFSEIEKKECTLSLRDGVIARTVSPVRVHVFYHAPDGVEYELKEQHQTYMDNGRMNPRIRPAAIGEKIRKGETVDAALVRSLHEELGIDGPVKTKEQLESLHHEGPSTSYPGIISVHETIYPFRVHLSDEQYNVGGYVEVDGDKVTCFNWVKKE